MPDEPTWLHRIPALIQTLENSRVPVIDRFAMERLFLVGRRQAIRLLSLFGGYQVGRSYIIEREHLLERLRAVLAGAPVDRAVHRKQRLWQTLTRERAQLKARGISILLPSVASIPRFSALPDGVVLEPGILTITYGQPLELLQKLHALGQALAHDFEGFQRLHASPS